MIDKPEKMPWRIKVVCRILLIIARIMVDDKTSELHTDLVNLHNHISSEFS